MIEVAGSSAGDVTTRRQETNVADPVNDAMREALLAALLGSTSIPNQYVDANGMTSFGTITVGSIFEGRLRDKAYRGDFDDLLTAAMKKVDPAAVARAFEGLFAKKLLDGLQVQPGYNSQPGWLQQQARSIAIEATTTAIKDDEDLLDRLRTMIGSQVERDSVSINVSLATRETT